MQVFQEVMSYRELWKAQLATALLASHSIEAVLLNENSSINQVGDAHYLIHLHVRKEHMAKAMVLLGVSKNDITTREKEGGNGGLSRMQKVSMLLIGSFVGGSLFGLAGLSFIRTAPDYFRDGSGALLFIAIFTAGLIAGYFVVANKLRR